MAQDSYLTTRSYHLNRNYERHQYDQIHGTIFSLD